MRSVRIFAGYVFKNADDGAVLAEQVNGKAASEEY